MTAGVSGFGIRFSILQISGTDIKASPPSPLERESALPPAPGHLPIPSDGCYGISMLGTLDAQSPSSRETQHHSNHTRKLGQPEGLKERQGEEEEGGREWVLSD